VLVILITTTLVVLGVGRTIAIALADSGREELGYPIAVSGILSSSDVEFTIWTTAMAI
jgi:hypothetical protein